MTPTLPQGRLLTRAHLASVAGFRWGDRDYRIFPQVEQGLRTITIPTTFSNR